MKTFCRALIVLMIGVLVALAVVGCNGSGSAGLLFRLNGDGKSYTVTGYSGLSHKRGHRCV